MFKSKNTPRDCTKQSPTIINASKFMVYWSIYTYDDSGEIECESGVIENPKEIEIASTESFEQSFSAEIIIPDKYLKDEFKDYVTKVKVIVPFSLIGSELSININGNSFELLKKDDSKELEADILKLFSIINNPIIKVIVNASGVGISKIGKPYIKLYFKGD